MDTVSVRLDEPSPYLEPDSFFYRMKRKLTYRFALRAIRRHGPATKNFSLLEIGTGSGYFLSAAHDCWPDAHFQGLEYDPRLLAATQARAPFAHCVQGNAEAFEFPDQQFDVIASFQVIEHLFVPAAMLANVRNHLKPKGIFILTTPNLDSFGARWLRDKWHGYREDHVSLKPFAQWKALLEETGFIPLYCGSTFFSGVPVLNRLPLGLFNWMLLVIFGAARWKHGEAFVGIYKITR